MNVNQPIYKYLNYSEEYFNFVINEQDDKSLLNTSYARIFFVFSGELIIDDNGEILTIGKDEYVFIKAETNVRIIKKNKGNEHFCGAYIGFCKLLLFDFYCKSGKKLNLCCPQTCCCNIIKLSYNPYIHSLYLSIKVYLEWGRKPSNNIIVIKQLEGIYCLLLTDDRFQRNLFDFIDS